MTRWHERAPDSIEEILDVVDTVQSVAAHVPDPLVRALFGRGVLHLERLPLIRIAEDAAFEVSFLARVAADDVARAVADLDDLDP